jgi:DNA-binding transcriptional MerR regulator
VNALRTAAGGTPDEALRIGDLAARADVSADTLRYYERRGLLQPSGRRASGYREYLPDAVGVVQFIKHAQALGFTLAEVDELLRLRGTTGGRGAALEVRDVAIAKIRDIDEKLRMLGALRGALADLVAECEQTCGVGTAATNAPDCPIIAALNHGDRDAAPPAGRRRVHPEPARSRAR